MGSAASLDVGASIAAASDIELRGVATALSQEQRAKLMIALGEKLHDGEQWSTLEVAVTLLSGRKLPSISADASWTGLQLKSSLTKHVDKDSCIKELRDGLHIFQDAQSLQEFCSASKGSVDLQAVVGTCPEHQLWIEFETYCPGGLKLRKMLIAADEKTTASTIELIRRMEAQREESSGENTEDRFGRMRFVAMSKDVSRSQHVDHEIMAIPSESDYADASLILDCCRSHSVDAVIVGSGTIGGSDPKLVHRLKVMAAEAGLQIVVFGQSRGVDALPAEPAFGWKALSTTPPAGMRTISPACPHCRSLKGDDVSGEVECELSEHLSACLKSDGYPCASWFHCTACGAACYGPDPGCTIGALIGSKIFGGHSGYVFKSSLPEAAGITFALYSNDEELLVEAASQADGEFVLVDGAAERATFYDEQDSYLERLRALSFEETRSESGPGKAISFAATGYRQDTQTALASVADKKQDEEDETGHGLEPVVVKRAKWLGFSSGLEWDDGEMWECLGILKQEEQEEE